MPTSQFKKLRVGVLFGGRSAEHEVSLASGRAIMSNLDQSRYEIVPILITLEGSWRILPKPEAEPEEGSEVFFPPVPGKNTLLFPEGGEAGIIDVFFPIIHGTFGEDGTLQGLLEMAGAAFVGPGCLSSAVSMDKTAAKALLRAAGLPVLPSLNIIQSRWEVDRAGIIDDASSDIGFPLFVKPASTGSSVGIHRVESAKEFTAAVDNAFSYDFKVLIEEEAKGRELECAVIEDPSGGPPLASPLAEIRPLKGWYDYEAKYTLGKTEVIIPADISGGAKGKMQEIARTAFGALGCSGLARVDFFFRETRGEIYINELNTLPGFTELSGYPKMIAKAGIDYSSMLDRLIECALARQARTNKRLYRKTDNLS
ncbi:MAG: D-alanine--D-alanine ligase [Nitrospinaceae bacterium]|jgi:D-alanine-D-alanine ligase|nr:D-alanine--D-alanine ligase [Nitrospinaceae bacterium]MBT3821338.1 D-alanine--D-alanine ligase [Nitrospinaceae bacterium]MBT4095357.1 D-alanine--D-alanine ligase [Nitrospinaceae bacterium]MBT4432446.1 D-alanine--D-alanine ligase [Nitrospinaceae bacterium]MBT5366658.1 D-alanine--D-alanine ligase [Nitrospinaceae bacterium]